MTRPGSPARSIMRTLRTGLSRPRGTDLSPLLPLARQALAFIDRGSVNDPDTAGEAGELAFVLAALLEVGDTAFHRQAFGLLFRLGVEGEVLAVRFLETLPEHAAVAILETLGDADKLLFANAFSRRPRPFRPKTARFCRDALADVVARVPDEVLILLELLASRQEYPALPVRNALVRGHLGIWLHQLLDMDLSADQTQSMARVIGRLREPGLMEKLLDRLGAMDTVSATTACRALAETPGINPALAAAPLTALAGVPDPALAQAALGALAACAPSRAAAAAAKRILAAPHHAEQLAPFLATLPLAACNQVLDALPPATRQTTLVAIYAVLAAALPGTMSRAARTAVASGQAPSSLGQLLHDDLAVRNRTAARPFAPRPPLPGPVVARQSPNGLWRRMKSLVGSDKAGSGGTDATAALRRELAPGNSIRNNQFQEADLDGLAVTGITVSQCAFQTVQFGRTSFTDATFTDCQFTDVRFEEAKWNGIVFHNCRFSFCRFSASVLEKVTFFACHMHFCDFVAVTGRDVRFEAVSLDESDFANAAIINLSLIRSRVEATRLARTVLHEFSGQGVVFSDCLFEMAAFPRASLHGVRTQGCYFAGSRFSGVTDEPDILGAMVKDNASALAETALVIPVPPQLVSGPGLRLVAACCQAALFSQDVAKRRRAFLASNKRRLSWAKRRLGEKGAAFLEMLPLLIEAPLVQDVAGPRPAPAARIAGLHPDLPTTRLVADHFGQEIPEALPQTATALAVEAVYTIGSLGSVAQGPDSDLDIWVCLAQQAIAHPDYPAFQEKLETISQQAMARDGLEIHFFCMTGKDVRDNVFGYSADEGQGSAQGCLLQEEFYRTTLLLAGKKPAWWCMAPGIDAPAYAETLDNLAHTEPDLFADTLDCGCLQPIAANAYFGASLWIIVKSLTSPFKSIMKFGLLEKYATTSQQPGLLCETLKRSLFANRGGLWHCDPYALLFSEVTRHYQEHGQMEAVELLRQAFLHKTGFDPCAEYGSRDDDPLLDHYFPYAPPAPGSCAPPPGQRATDAADNSFARAMALCDAITRHFLRVYGRLKERGRELASGGGLTERDQAMLSRRIAASFARKSGKIMRLPFVRPGRGLFDALEFSFEGMGARKKGFVLRGLRRGEDRHQTRLHEAVRQDLSLPRLCAWVAANELYRPGMHLSAANLPAPLVLPDIAGLLAAVYAMFPPRETFSPPLSRGLEKEVVTAVLIVVNLLVRREERRTLTADVLYATSWGELLHLERATDLTLLDNSPPRFLTETLGLSLENAPRLAIHVPAKARCPAGRQTMR